MFPLLCVQVPYGNENSFKAYVLNVNIKKTIINARNIKHFSLTARDLLKTALLKIPFPNWRES